MLKITNETLVLELKHLVTEERKITAKILEYLREAEARKLFLKMGYPSLFELCVKELGYSEGSAQRRISAMRLIKEVPEVQDKIVSGELSLSVVSQVQSFFKKQERNEGTYSKADKLELLEKLENTSTRQCEKVLLTLDPEPIRQDKERIITNELTEIRMTVDQDFTLKLDKLKNLLSNSNPNISTQEVLKMALDLLLSKKDPNQNKQIQKKSLSAPAVKSRYIPLNIKREVWWNSKGQCCFKDPKTGRACGSKRFLEIDHIVPYYYGGSNTTDNLQLLCGSHNKIKGMGFDLRN